MSDKLFNVDMDGVRVATGIPREEAEKYLRAREEIGARACYVYLLERPLDAAGRPKWRAPSIPRLPSMRVSDADRQKLTDKLLADGTLAFDDQDAQP